MTRRKNFFLSDDFFFLSISRQLSSSMKAFQPLGGALDFSRQLSGSLSSFQELSDLTFAKKMQSSVGVAARHGFDGVTIDRSLNSALGLAADWNRVFQGTSGIWKLGESTSMIRRSLGQICNLAGLDLIRQFHSSIGMGSLAKQLGLLNIATGVLGPTSAINAWGSFAGMKFPDHGISRLLEHLADLEDDDVDDQPSIQDTVFSEDAWSELKPRVRSWLKAHYVSLLLATLALVHAQVLYMLAQSSSAEQSAECREVTLALRQDYQDQSEADERSVEKLSAELEAVSSSIEQVSGQLGDLHRELDKDQQGLSVDGAEHRITDHTIRAFAQPRSRSAVVARIPEGETVFVFEHRRKWVYVGYADVVTGRPITGWIRKKYTHRPSQSSHK